MARCEVRGSAFGFERTGSGVDLVWGHGLAQSRALEDHHGLIDWSSVPAMTLRYDARGHGESSSTADLDGYSWQALAHDQLALTGLLEIGPYIAAGASMGAATALHAAVLAPERVRGLILVIPPTGWEARAGQAEVYEQGARAVEAFGVEPLIKAGALVAPPDPFLDDPDYRTSRADGLRTWEPARLAQVLRGATRAQLPDREEIARLTCPTLILAWTGDPVHPVATADTLSELLPQAERATASTATEIANWTALISGFVRSISD